MEKAKIVVYVSGGVVQGAYSSVVPVAIEVFDVDNKKADGKTDAQITKELKKVTKGMEVVY